MDRLLPIHGFGPPLHPGPELPLQDGAEQGRNSAGGGTIPTTNTKRGTAT